MSETVLVRQIMLAVSKAGHRVFRNNTGLGWVGRSEKSPFSDMMILRNPRPLHAGLCVGSSDIIGWTKTGRFLAIEVKSRTGKMAKDQYAFLCAVCEAGGIGVIGRSVAQVLAEIKDQEHQLMLKEEFRELK